MRPNQDIKDLIHSNGLNQALVAQEIGISYPYFTRWLSAPMTPDHKRRTIEAIKRLIDKRKKQLQRDEKRVLEWLESSESGEDWCKEHAKK